MRLARWTSALVWLSLGCSAAGPGAPPPRASAPPPKAAPRELRARWFDTSGESVVGPRLDATQASLSGGRLLVEDAAGPRALEAPEPLEEVALVALEQGFEIVARGPRRVFALRGAALEPVGQPAPREQIGLGALPGAALVTMRGGDTRVLPLRGGPPPRLPDLPVRGAAFSDARTGALVVVGLGVQVTRDGGATWTAALDPSGAPASAPDVRVDAEGGRARLRADWYGRAEAEVAPGGGVGARRPRGEPRGPGARWLLATGVDPVEAAAADGVPITETLALAASAGVAALVDLERGVVVAAETVIPLGVGTCGVARTAAGAVIGCATDARADGPGWAAHAIAVSTDPPGLAAGPRVGAARWEGGAVPRGGVWVPAPCESARAGARGACVLQPSGRLETVEAPGAIAALSDGRAVAAARSGERLVFTATSASGDRTELGAVAAIGVHAAAAELVGGELVVLLEREGATELAVLARGAAAIPRPLPGAALGGGRVAALEGDALLESVDGGATWARTTLPPALAGGPATISVGPAGVVVAAARARGARLGRAEGPVIPASLAAPAPPAADPPDAPRLLRCRLDGRAARSDGGAGAPILGPLQAPVGRVDFGAGRVTWLGGDARPRSAAVARGAGPAWLAGGEGRGAVAALAGGRALLAEGASVRAIDLPAHALEGPLGPLSVSGLGASWTAGARLIAARRAAPAEELGRAAEPLELGSPAPSGAPAWLEAPGGAWVRWLKGATGALDASGWARGPSLAALVAAEPCKPPRGSSRLVSREPRGAARVELGGLVTRGAALPVAAVPAAGAACLEELWIRLDEAVPLDGIAARWIVLSAAGARALGDRPLDRAALRCETVPG